MRDIIARARLLWDGWTALLRSDAISLLAGHRIPLDMLVLKVGNGSFLNLCCFLGELLFLLLDRWSAGIQIALLCMNNRGRVVLFTEAAVSGQIH